MELQLERKNGREITVLEHARAVKSDSGNVILFEGTVENITAGKALEERLDECIEALKASYEALAAMNAKEKIRIDSIRSPFLLLTVLRQSVSSMAAAADERLTRLFNQNDLLPGI